MRHDKQIQEQNAGWAEHKRAMVEAFPFIRKEVDLRAADHSNEARMLGLLAVDRYEDYVQVFDLLRKKNADVTVLGITYDATEQKITAIDADGAVSIQKVPIAIGYSGRLDNVYIIEQSLTDAPTQPTRAIIDASNNDVYTDNLVSPHRRPEFYASTLGQVTMAFRDISPRAAGVN